MVKDGADNVNKVLEHSGIFGMHWGHRKASGWASKDHTAAKDHISKQGGAIQKPDKTTKTTSIAPRLTDSQLKDRVSRLQMEKMYAQLTKKEMSPGRKIITDILVNAAKANAQVYFTKMMGKGMDRFMNSKTDTPPIPPSHANGFV